MISVHYLSLIDDKTRKTTRMITNVCFMVITYYKYNINKQIETFNKENFLRDMKIVSFHWLFLPPPRGEVIVA